jgi:hypothetical protein
MAVVAWSMRSVAGILGLVLTAAIVYYAYSGMFSGMERGAAPVQQIDLVGVRTDLISLAQAERIFLATNGTYGTLEQLQRPGIGRRGYVYEVEVDGGRHFRISARPSATSRQEWPVLSIDETMQISTSAPSERSGSTAD